MKIIVQQPENIKSDIFLAPNGLLVVKSNSLVWMHHCLCIYFIYFLNLVGSLQKMFFAFQLCSPTHNPNELVSALFLYNIQNLAETCRLILQLCKYRALGYLYYPNVDKKVVQGEQYKKKKIGKSSLALIKPVLNIQNPIPNLY